MTANIHKLIKVKNSFVEFIKKSKNMPTLFISNLEIVLIGQ